MFIYASVTPCITCAKQGGAEKQMMPIINEQEAAFCERPFRAPLMAAGWTGVLEQPVVPEQPGMATPKHSAALGWLERHPAGILRFRGRFERYPSSILPVRGRLEQHLSSTLPLRRKHLQHFSSILRLQGRLERPFRASSGSKASSSGHFEPTVGNMSKCRVFEPRSRGPKAHEAAKPRSPEIRRKLQD